MSRLLKNAIAAVKAARPASGMCPETPEEWARLLNAHEDLGYAMLRSQGQDKAQARAAARSIFGGAGGRAMLQYACKSQPGGVV